MHKFPIIKENILMKGKELEEALSKFLKDTSEINNGMEYYNNETISDFNWIVEKLNDLEKLHKIGLDFNETCQCGSGFIPRGFDENESLPFCKECEHEFNITTSGL